MRQDQFLKLQALEEKLLDVFISEADPANWPGQGISIANMDQQTRGNMYWVRKTAASVGMLATKVGSMIGATQFAGAGTNPAADVDDSEKQLDSQLASAEKEASALMAELQTGTKKRVFDRKVHGS